MIELIRLREEIVKEIASAEQKNKSMISQEYRMIGRADYNTFTFMLKLVDATIDAIKGKANKPTIFG